MSVIESCLLVGFLAWLGMNFGIVGGAVGIVLGLMMVSEAWGRSQ